MASDIPFLQIERDPHRSLVRWIYIFDRGGRRHILGVNLVKLDTVGARLMIRHHLVRKGISLGPFEETPLAADDLITPPVHLAFLDHLVDDPLQLGEPIAAFLERHFHRIAAHVEASAHEKMSQTSQFREALARARQARKQVAAARRRQLDTARAAGIVPIVDLKDGRLVRLCPKRHQDLCAEALSTTYRVSRKSPRSRRFSLVAINGPLKGQRFAPPGHQQVYLAAEAESA